MDIYRTAGRQALAQDEANWEGAVATAQAGGRSCTQRSDCPPGKFCNRSIGKCVTEDNRGNGGQPPAPTPNNPNPNTPNPNNPGGGRDCVRNSDCPSGKRCGTDGRCANVGSTPAPTPPAGGGNTPRPPAGTPGSTQNTKPPADQGWANQPVGQTPVASSLPNYANSWFSNIPGLSLNNWANDPSQVAYAFAENQGWGRGTNALLNQWGGGNPYDVLYGLGYGDQIGWNTPSRVNAASDLWKSVATGPNYVDPRQIMGNLVNISTGEAGTNNPWETLLADPSLTPQQQVQQVISYVGSVMQGLMPADALQAYMMQLNNVARQYVQYASSNPTNAGTFVKYIGQVLGPYGGLG